MKANRIFMPEQIEVHPDLPGVLKEFSKAVIRENPKTEADILAFSADYFNRMAGGNSPPLYVKKEDSDEEQQAEVSLVANTDGA